MPCLSSRVCVCGSLGSQREVVDRRGDNFYESFL